MLKDSAAIERCFTSAGQPVAPITYVSREEAQEIVGFEVKLEWDRDKDIPGPGERISSRTSQTMCDIGKASAPANTLVVTHGDLYVLARRSVAPTFFQKGTPTTACNDTHTPVHTPIHTPVYYSAGTMPHLWTYLLLLGWWRKQQTITSEISSPCFNCYLPITSSRPLHPSRCLPQQTGFISLL